MPNPVARRLRTVVSKLLRLPRGAKRAILVCMDLCAIPFALWSALTLRLGTFDHGAHGASWLYLVAAVTSIPIFVRVGLYRAVLRYMAGRATMAVFAGVSASVALSMAVNLVAMGGAVPKTAFVIYFLIAMVYVAGSRVLARHLFDLVRAPQGRVIIYGAGESGVHLAQALRKNRLFKPVALVDEDPAHHGSVVSGLEVYPPSQLQKLVSQFRPERVLLALPSATRAKRRQIIQRLEPLGVHVQTMPDMADILSGRARVDELREIDSFDVLGRDPVPPDERLLAACITGKSVLVTGAGGSIGSELCRQIVQLKPSRIVLLEMAEHALYRIDRELRQMLQDRGESLEIVPLLGNAHHRHRVHEVMQTFGIQTVYHAAAYKHVPIVEANIGEGIHNNIMATFHTAKAALETGVETFVLISTDKAVNPTNVMGATKRVAELVLQGLHRRGSKTKFCMVRFGNVLDSSGSVVPLFREQIMRGGPVTVTHPEVTRYFMTIPEAAQLVLQAGSMARGGDVFVLDMGQPVRIVDLARRMIHLTGLTVKDADNPDGDIAIEYTGLRPGEKLYEELLIGDNVTTTDHPRIRRALEHSLPWDEVRRLLDQLLEAALSFDCERAIRLLSDAVVEYRPSPELVDLVAVRREELGLRHPAVPELASRRATQAGATVVA